MKQQGLVRNLGLVPYFLGAVLLFGGLVASPGWMLRNTGARALSRALVSKPPMLSGIDSSEQAFEDLLAQQGDNSLTLLHLSQIADLRGQPQQALVRLERARAAAPANSPVLVSLLRNYLASGDNLAAVSLLRDLGAADQIAQLVFDLYDEQKISIGEAVWMAEQAVLVNPRSSAATAQLGWMSYLQDHDLNAAVQSLQKAIELDPNNWYPLLRLADIYVHHEHAPETAKPYAMEMVRRWPQLDLAHALMGDVWLALDEDSLAEAEYIRAVEISPAVSHIVVRLADLYAATGRTDRAIPLWEGVVNGSPSYWRYRLRLAAAYAAVGENEQALEHLQQANREHPNDAEVQKMLISLGVAP